MADIRRIAIVNRGEAAVRFIKAVGDYNRRHGTEIITIALVADGDRRQRFAREADERVSLGADVEDGDRRHPVYSDLDRLETAIVAARADAVWAGWGFAADRPEFVDVCQRLGVTFIGPPASVMRMLGDKASAKRLAAQIGLAVVPWGGSVADSLATARAHAQRLGYPVVVKATRGVGGRGVRKVASPADLPTAFDAATDEARRATGNDAVLVEKWIEGARHEEVQVVADRHGTTWAVDVRHASVQRRHQKLLEESPSPGLPPDIDRMLRAAAVRLCGAAGYESVGSIEFLYEPSSRQVHFLEVNPWLPVEHPVTELTTGIDLAMLQLHLSRGGLLQGDAPVARGHAVEVRLTAEDAERGFAPAPGTIRVLRVPTRPGLRLDTGVSEGDEIRAEYDSMFAKLVAWAPTRAEALDTLEAALGDSTILVAGGASNRAFLLHLLADEDLRRGGVSVDWLDDLVARGTHVSRERADLALVQAAIDVYEEEFLAERDEFLASAQRLRPQVRHEIGRTVELRYRGHRYVLKVFRLGFEHYRVDVDGARVDVYIERMSPHESMLTCGGERHRVLSSRVGLAHLVEIGSAAHRISLDEVGVVRADGPAVVVSLGAAPGDRVAAGQVVAVLEAMKMESAVLAPCSGIVRDVAVLPNAQVGNGTRLLTIEPDDAEAASSDTPRVTFSGETLTPAEGGAQVSRVKAALAGFKAFTHALTPPDEVEARAVLDDLHAIVLGSDIDAVEARRVIDDYRRLADRLPPPEPNLCLREDTILEGFADIAALFERQGAAENGDDPTALSAGQYFLTYLRTLESKGDGLPVSFVSGLRRALRHYGSDSLEVTDALRTRLLWVYRSHMRIDQQVGVVLAILDRRLRHAPALLAHASGSFLDVLDRIIGAMEHEFPTVTDLARDVRYRFFEQPIFERGRQAVYAEMEAHLGALIRDPASHDRDTRLRALVDCPLPLGGLLSGRFEDAPPTLRQVMLEVLTRRYYRIRDLDSCSGVNLDGRSLCTAAYQHEGRRHAVVASHARWSELREVLGVLSDRAAKAGEDVEVLFDLYVWRDDEFDASHDATAEGLRELLDQAHVQDAVQRVVIAVGGRRAEWSASQTRHFTFRRVEGRWVEDRLFRGVHPMLGKRLQVSRLERFTTERLPSVEDVFLFKLTARENPRDQRLFALAEVRDVTPLVDEAGVVVQIPHLERMLLETAASIREVQSRRGADERLHWNRILLDVWPPLDVPVDQFLAVMRRVARRIEGLGLEKVVVRARMRDGESGELADRALGLSWAGGRGLVLQVAPPSTRIIEPLDEYTQKAVRMRQRGLTYPYEVVRLLTPGREHTASDLPPGEFVEYDLDADGELTPVDRPAGRNKANVVVGVVRNFTAKHPEGVTRVVVLGDPSREMGSMAEPECRRICEGLDLAERMDVPFEWFALSAGAKISMESGTENMDWIGRVLRRIIEFTQAGREINIVVTGINVGAQPYWNAEATMLMHTRGILVMMPESAMVLTGKTALDYSGSVSAEDNIGIGGYERIMGPNGQAQYFARDLAEACRILLRHYDHSYLVPGERFPRRAETTDPLTRDVCAAPHGHVDGASFVTVGDVFSRATNPGRKKPFDIRRIMAAVSDQDHQPLERWAGWRDAEVAVVWDAHVGGYPVAMIGFESRSLSRLGFVPTDGPDHWTSGTLFPMSSKKIARSINAASGNRPLVVLANLSGFDGSPESMRRRQLEFGAEIGRAVTNFQGPIVFVVISRYHGGAFVVFSRTLNDNMQVAALEGTYASVIGGAPAAAVVFAREVDLRARKDARVVSLEQEIASADDATKRRLRPRLASLVKALRAEKLGEVAEEFDRIHSVQRAVEVGSVDVIIPPDQLRPWLVQAIGAGMAKELARSKAMDVGAP